MDSLLQEVKEKLVEVEKALTACESERNLLNKNLTLTKRSVDDSFKRHIGTLQCRAKWLICHADSIFHLKEGSLGQQVAELELIANELTNCLDAGACNLNSSNEIGMMSANVLQNASKVSTQPCESGSMVFSADDNKMEESIISFGDIDLSSFNDFDLVSEEGIVVVETPIPRQHAPHQQNSIEMEVKSIEMHHMTAQSAANSNDRAEHFETVDMQETHVMTSRHDGSESSWLHSSSQQKSEDGGDEDVMVCESEQELVDEKVPQWLNSCRPLNPWVKPSPVNALTMQTSGTQVEIPSQREDDEEVLALKRQGGSLSSFMENESANLHHINGIFRASNSKFLRIDVEQTNSSVLSLDTALDSLVILEKETRGLLKMEEKEEEEAEMKKVSSNLDHFMGIFNSANSNFLRGNVQATLDDEPTIVSNDDNEVMRMPTIATEESVLDRVSATQLDELNNSSNIDHFWGIFNSPSSSFLRNENKVATMTDGSSSIFGGSDMLLPESISDIQSVHTESTYNSRASNLDHLDRIVSTPHSNFIVDVSADRRVTTYTPSPNLAYFSKIENQPNSNFLRRSPVKKTELSPELCGWLRSEPEKSCAQCPDFSDCGFSSKFDSKWIKTASDW